VFGLGALVPQALLVRPWTPFTYMFRHDRSSLFHILFNMLALYFFGPRLEDRLGGKHFIILYIGGGLAGALCSVLFTPRAIVVGASAAVYAVTVGFTMFWPRTRIYLYGLIPVEAWLLMVIYVGWGLWAGLQGGGNIAHFAHLGGMAWGAGYIKWMEWHLGAAKREFQKKIQEIPSATLSERGALERWEAIDTKLLHELNRHEVEQLLRKARALGVRALSQDERAFLDRMTARN
jgi:membrane associated rhomboid family serine protease